MKRALIIGIKGQEGSHLAESLLEKEVHDINYPIALEGSLKLKEISYICAEGYPAGEMK